MGANSFFSMFGSHDPLAQALNLPGAHKYAQSQTRMGINNNQAITPYGGVAPTLAGANAGYTAGGPGANASAMVPKAAPAQPMSTWQQGTVSPFQSR